MEKVISIVAVAISITSLLLGGWFSGSWDKEIKKASTSIKINSIGFSFKNEGNRKIEIPSDLQERSKKSQYVPTLTKEMTVDEIKEIVEDSKEYQSSLTHIRLAQQQLSEKDLSNTEVSEIWESVLSDTDQAAFFQVKAKRIGREKLIELRTDPSLINDIVDEVIEETNSEEVDTKKRGIKRDLINSVYKEIGLLIAEIQFSPTQGLLKKIISEDINSLEVVTYEYKQLSSELTKLVDISKTNNKKTLYWEAEFNIYNSGGEPDTLIPIATMAVQKVGSGNTVLIFEAADTTGNIYVEPKKSYNIKFISKYENDKKIVHSLLDLYDSGDRDVRFILKRVDGKFIESQIVNFSSEPLAKLSIGK